MFRQLKRKTHQRLSHAAMEVMERRVLMSAYSFTGISMPAGTLGGASPQSSLVEDAYGNLYGTTSAGGSANQGTVFEIPYAASTPVTFASFIGLNGATPLAGLTIDSQGNLFGTTSAGGMNGAGTVFEIPRGSQTITTLAQFDGQTATEPETPVLIDSQGDLFGTTCQDGPSATVYEIPAGTHTLQIIATMPMVPTYHTGFANYCWITLDSSGNIFGDAATSAQVPDGYEGNNSTIFEVPHGSTQLTTLATFDSTDNPSGPMIIDNSGNLYGVSSTRIFKLSTGSQPTLGTYYTFQQSDPPLSNLTWGPDSQIMGTTFSGSSGGEGGIFQIANGQLNVLANFNESSGWVLSGLFVDSQHNIFGTTSAGGTAGQGSVFEILTGQSTISTVASFSTLYNSLDGSTPHGIPQLDQHGDLYGYTWAGGLANDGTLYELPAGSTQPLTLASFSDGPTSSGGAEFIADFGDKQFTATYDYGGQNFGPNYNLSIPAGLSTPELLVLINRLDQNFGNAVADSVGNIYFGSDKLYEIPKGTSSIEALAALPGGYPSIAIDASGNVFGAAMSNGTVFQYSNGVMTTLATLQSAPAGIALDSNDDIFGFTLQGTVFKIAHGKSSVQTLDTLAESSAFSPGGIAVDAKGDAFVSYGTTSFSALLGSTGSGVIEIPSGASTAALVHNFNGYDGDVPAGLVLTSNGILDGTTTSGGSNGTGTLFSLTPQLLTPSIVHSSLPPQIFADKPLRGAAMVQVVNTSGVLSSGATTISVYATTSGTIDGNSELLGSVTRKLKIAAGRNIRLSVPIVSTAGLNGSYTLLVQTTGPTGLISAATTGPSVMTATPFTAIGLSAASIAARRNGSAVLTFTATNKGNLPWADRTVLSIVATANSSSGGPELVSRQVPLRLPVGGSRTLHIHLTAKQHATAASSGGLHIELIDNGIVAAQLWLAV